MNRGVEVEYVDYIAPASFKMHKENQPNFNATAMNNGKGTDEPNFAISAPLLIKQAFMANTVQ